MKAPPDGGQANAELVSLLSAVLGVPGTAVRVVGGRTGRRKVVEVDLAAEEIERRLSR